jgi:hypothetical protein
MTVPTAITFFLTGWACFVELPAGDDRIAPAEEPKKVPDTFSSLTPAGSEIKRDS